MVSIKTLVGAGLAALPSASAYIYGFENYVDYSIIWGIARTGLGSCAPDACVGTQIGYKNFYPEEVPLGNFTVDVTIPKDTPAGESVLTAAIPYLVGAGGLTKVAAYNATIDITAA
ncbi:hypothetical protein PG997_009288 [Apiospora hydei]|uniref:Uncharacterized protein n=1 Tax=Apiospora hydei TaxID=1337664 RepID=A0ABR1VTN9_9PEZI